MYFVCNKCLFLIIFYSINIDTTTSLKISVGYYLSHIHPAATN